MATLKQITTRVPQEVYDMWLEHCKKQKRTSYEVLQKMVTEKLGIDIKKGWIIEPKKTMNYPTNKEGS